jgi:hypothetical protein
MNVKVFYQIASWCMIGGGGGGRGANKLFREIDFDRCPSLLDGRTCLQGSQIDEQFKKVPQRTRSK